MTQATAQPLLVSDAMHAAPGVTLTVETADLHSPAYVRIHREDAEDILVPLDLIPSLSVNLAYFRNISAEGRGELKRLAHYPAAPGGLCVETDMPRRITLPGYDLHVDGTPYLNWYGEEEGGPAGWALELQGLDGSQPLAFVHWDDENGIADLVESMRDPDALLSLAAVIEPAETRVMTSRIAVKELRASQRDLPEADLESLKDVLDNLECTKTLDKVAHGQRAISILRIPLDGDEKWGVAALVRYAMYSKYHSVDAWLSTAEPELAEAGWFLADLPVIKQKYHGEVSVWLTPLSEGVWDIVEPLANLYATQIQSG